MELGATQWIGILIVVAIFTIVIRVIASKLESAGKPRSTDEPGPEEETTDEPGPEEELVPWSLVGWWNVMAVVNLLISTITTRAIWPYAPEWLRNNLTWPWVSLILLVLYYLIGAGTLDFRLMAMKSLWGRLRKFVDSGLYFVHWPFEKINVLPKTRLKITITEIPVLTESSTETEGVEDEEKKKEKSQIEIFLDTEIFVSFGQTKKHVSKAMTNLPKEITQHAGNIEDLQTALAGYLQQLIASDVISYVSGLSWEEVSNQVAAFEKEVQEKLMGGETFKLVGLAKAEVKITKVAGPPEIIAANIKQETAERDKTIKILEGEGDKRARILAAEATEREGVANALAKRVDIEAVKEAMKLSTKDFRNYREFLKAAESIKEGDKFFIGGITDAIKAVRGNNGPINPEELKNFLASEEGVKAMASLMASEKGKELLEKIKEVMPS